jgi:hypothetical protein
MSGGRKRRLVSGTGVGLVALSAIGSAAVDAISPPVELTAVDGAAADVPPGALNFDFTVPGMGTYDIWETGGLLPTDYGYGLTFVGDGVSFSGVSQGTSAGLSSTVSLETAMGGFSNTESYATSYWGLACLICNTFEITDPSGTAVITAETDIFLKGSPQFDLTTPWGTFDFPSSGVTVSAMAEPLTGLSALAGDPASSLPDLLALPNLIP